VNLYLLDRQGIRNYRRMGERRKKKEKKAKTDKHCLNIQRFSIREMFIYERRKI